MAKDVLRGIFSLGPVRLEISRRLLCLQAGALPAGERGGGAAPPLRLHAFWGRAQAVHRSQVSRERRCAGDSGSQHAVEAHGLLCQPRHCELSMGSRAPYKRALAQGSKQSPALPPSLSQRCLSDTPRLASLPRSRFALEEGVLALARLLTRFEFSLDPEHHSPGQPLDLAAGVTLIPRGGIWLQVEQRNAG